MFKFASDLAPVDNTKCIDFCRDAFIGAVFNFYLFVDLLPSAPSSANVKGP